jgi:hypothetical protein
MGMRIRQVRPEFFSDPVVSRLPADVRLTYIGLWCIADDAGYLIWDEPHIGALLYPYESVHVRERRVAKAGAHLLDSRRMEFYPCGCARIPRLEDHQKIGGNKSFTVRDRHRVHTVPDKSPGKLGNGSNGTLVAPASADALARRDEEDAAEMERIAARRLQAVR